MTGAVGIEPTSYGLEPFIIPLYDTPKCRFLRYSQYLFADTGVL